jgi:hypothetical protein
MIDPSKTGLHVHVILDRTLTAVTDTTNATYPQSRCFFETGTLSF